MYWVVIDKPSLTRVIVYAKDKTKEEAEKIRDYLRENCPRLLEGAEIIILKVVDIDGELNF